MVVYEPRRFASMIGVLLGLGLFFWLVPWAHDLLPQWAILLGWFAVVGGFGLLFAALPMRRVTIGDRYLEIQPTILGYLIGTASQISYDRITKCEHKPDAEEKTVDIFVDGRLKVCLPGEGRQGDLRFARICELIDGASQRV